MDHETVGAASSRRKMAEMRCCADVVPAARPVDSAADARAHGQGFGGLVQHTARGVAAHREDGRAGAGARVVVRERSDVEGLYAAFRKEDGVLELDVVQSRLLGLGFLLFLRFRVRGSRHTGFGAREHLRFESAEVRVALAVCHGRAIWDGRPVFDNGGRHSGAKEDEMFTAVPCCVTKKLASF